MSIVIEGCRPTECQKDCIQACQRVHENDAPLTFNEKVSRPAITGNNCTECLGCVRACPFGAITLRSKIDGEPSRVSEYSLRDIGSRKPYEIQESYQPFSERDIIFARVHYDPEYEGYGKYIYSKGPAMIEKGIPGYTRFEFELGQAAWKLYTNRYLLNQEFQDRDLEAVSKTRKATGDRGSLTKSVKRAAKFFGASLVGIAALDRRWLYTANRQGESYDIPNTVEYAIVIAVEMDYDDISTSPAMLSSSASVRGYSKMAYIEIELAAYIERLGFKAITCGNEVALSVPLAIDAGLGQYGRHGLLITKTFGPRVRIAKILTDMPLMADTPDHKFCDSVIRFCETCEKCATTCPSQSIPYGAERTWAGLTKSNNPRIHKWYVDVESCYGFWIENGGDCSNCIRSCPYNKRNAYFSRMMHNLVLWITQHMPFLNRLVVKLDDLFGFGRQQDSRKLWSRYD